MVCARSIKNSAQTQLSTYLLEAGVGGGDARTGAADGNGKVRTEANVSAGYQTKLEDLGPRSLALGDASGDGAAAARCGGCWRDLLHHVLGVLLHVAR